MKEKKYKKLTKDTFLFALGTFGTKILSFILVPLYTNCMNTESFGMADLFTTTATLLGCVFTLNISEAVLRFAIDDSPQENKRNVLNAALRIIFTGNFILMVILIGMYRIKILSWPLSYYIYILLLCLLNTLKSAFLNYLRAIDMISNYIRISIVSSLSFFCLNICFLVYLKLDIFGYFMATFLGETISILMSYYLIKKNSRRAAASRQDSILLRRAMLAYSMPLVVNSIGWWINNSIDRYFIINSLGASANGIYAAASKIPGILAMLQGVFAQAWNLSAIREYNSDSTDKFYTTVYSHYLMFSALGCSVLLMFNKWITGIWIASDYFEAWRYSDILLLSTILSGLSANIGSVFIAARDSKIFTTSTIWGAVVNILLNAVLLPVFGVSGAAWATVLSFFVMWLIRLRCVRKYTKASYLQRKDFMVFGLLLIQIALEKRTGMFFYFQGIVFLAMMMIYRKELHNILCKLIKSKQ